METFTIQWAINRSGRGWNPAVLVFNSLLVFHGAMTPKTALDSDFEVITLIMAAKTAATLYRKLRSNTVRPLTMKKKMLIFLFAAVIGVVAFVLARRAAVSKSVTVTFLLYTNCDAQGGNAFYTWAWFRIENRSPFTVGCYQGMLDVQRAGKWFQDTNNVGRHYFYSHTQPGKSSTIAMVVPENAARWRSSFLFEREDIEYINSMVISGYPPSRFATFMDNLHLERFGLHSKPWRTKPKRTTITSETMDL